jgi:GT2 family glycosyltransferase
MEGLTEIDIIILSYAQNLKLRDITRRCINSLLKSEDTKRIKFNVIVIESEKKAKPYQYENTTTIYPDMEFGYNRYMNIGIEMTSAKYICLCNNDLIFHPLWATEILRAFDKFYDLSSVSPLCSVHHPKLGFELNTGIYPGYRNRYEVTGWCLFLKRDVFRLIGKLDENYKFWCSDNDYANMLSVMHIGHALVSSSRVDHIEGATFDNKTWESQEGMTNGEFFYFEKKWNSRVDGRAMQQVY